MQYLGIDVKYWIEIKTHIDREFSGNAKAFIDTLNPVDDLVVINRDLFAFNLMLQNKLKKIEKILEA